MRPLRRGPSTVLSMAGAQWSVLTYLPFGHTITAVYSTLQFTERGYMHPNLSPEINAAIQAGNENPSINIENQQKGTMFDVVSGHTKYTIVVVDPEKQEVAMVTDNPKIPGTDLWYLMGAGWGGSMMKIGFIVVGAQMRMRRLSGGVIETSPVKSFSLRNEPEAAKIIVDEAESRRPRVMTEQEERDNDIQFAEAVEKIITKEFPEDKQEWIREMVGRFGNIPAKGVILGVLSQALKYGRFDKAQQLLERDWEEHWLYQPPFAAGDPEFMPLNAHRWDALYQELGIPLPSQD